MAGPITILLADDDEEDLELTEDAIKNVEPSAILVRMLNGKSVIEYLKKQADGQLPHLIILDYNMPEMNGSQVLAFLARDKRYELIPKLVLSTSGAPLHMHECMSNGADGYFVKPNNMNDLRKMAVEMIAYYRSA